MADRSIAPPAPELVLETESGSTADEPGPRLPRRTRPAQRDRPRRRPGLLAPRGAAPRRTATGRSRTRTAPTAPTPTVSASTSGTSAPAASSASAAPPTGRAPSSSGPARRRPPSERPRPRRLHARPDRHLPAADQPSGRCPPVPSASAVPPTTTWSSTTSWSPATTPSSARTPDGRFEIVDLGTHNGTYVNGQPVEPAPRVGPNDIVGVGHSTFCLVGDRLEEFVDTGEVSLDVQHLTVTVDGGRRPSWTTSPSRSRRSPCSPSSARPAPASPPCSRRSPATAPPTRARSSTTAATSTASSPSCASASAWSRRTTSCTRS